MLYLYKLYAQHKQVHCPMVIALTTSNSQVAQSANDGRLKQGKPRSVDMQFQFRACDTTRILAASGPLAQLRNRLFALIREYRQTVESDRGLNAAIRILGEILPCSGAYFAMTQSPYCDEHRRLLEDIRQILDRCSASSAKPMAAELSHALDGLVLHEAAIRLRTSCDLP